METGDRNQFSPISRVCVPSNSKSASQIFIKSFYTDLHDSRTDSLVPAIMDRRADVSHLKRPLLLNKKSARKQSVIFFWRGGREGICLFSDPHKTHKYVRRQNVELLNVKLVLHIVTSRQLKGQNHTALMLCYTRPSRVVNADI